jgi:hypothetical protein
LKLHTLADLRGNISTFVRITHGKIHDATVLDHLPIEPGAFCAMDREYVDGMSSRFSSGSNRICMSKRFTEQATTQ